MRKCDIPCICSGLTWLDPQQILILPFRLGTMTIPAHHTVGVVIFKIITSFSILSKSALTLGNNGNVTHLGVAKAKGFASLSNCIL